MALSYTSAKLGFAVSGPYGSPLLQKLLTADGNFFSVGASSSPVITIKYDLTDHPFADKNLFTRIRYTVKASATVENRLFLGVRLSAGGVSKAIATTGLTRYLSGNSETFTVSAALTANVFFGSSVPTIIGAFGWEVTAGQMSIDYIKCEIATDESLIYSDLATKSPALGQSIGGAAHAWTTPQQVTALDGTVASQNTDVSAVTNDYLHTTDYGFTIPSTNSVGPIGVRFDATCSGGTIVGDTLQLIVGGIRTGDNVVNSQAIWDTANGYGDFNSRTVYSGHPVLYGVSLTPTNVNVSDFGIALRVRGGLGTVQLLVDRVQLLLYSAPPLQGADSSEYDHEIKSVSVVKTNTLVTPAEFDHEIQSVYINSANPFISCEYDHEIKSVACSADGHAVVHPGQGGEIANNGNEYDHEISRVRIRYFEAGKTFYIKRARQK